MITCAIIGCGRNVEDLHMPAFHALKEVEVIACCDMNHSRLKEFGKKYDINNQFINFDELLKSNLKIDFVDVSTPGKTHYEICMQALESGFNLLVEKPITLSLKETLDLKNIAEKKKLKVCVIQNYRYRDVVLQAKKDMDEGRIGTINQVNVTFHGQSVFNEPTPWSWKEREYKTLLYEICIHFVDLQIYFAGRVKRIIGVKSSCSDILQCTEKIYALVEHENGAIGIIDLQFNTSSNYTHLELFGSANDVLIKFFPEYYCLYSGNINPLDELYYDFKRIFDFAIPVLKEKFKKPQIKRRAKAHYRLFKQFIDALVHDEKMPVSLDDVIPTMELVEELSKIAYCQVP